MSPKDMTTDWLGERLNRQVEEVRIGKSFESNNAILTPVTVIYTDSTSASDLLLLKQYRAFHGVIAEVKFYRDLVPMMTVSPAPRCPAAEYDLDEETGYLLMEDLSVTHQELYAVYQDAPRYYERIIDTLALLHSQWWDHDRIHEEDFMTPHGGPLRMPQMTTSETRQEYVETFQKAYHDYFERFQGQVTDTWYEIVKRVTENWLRLMDERSESPLTMTHGDVHTGNIYVPKDEQPAPIFLVDWETYKRSFGPSDVAFFIVLSIAPEVRRQIEGRLLERYYEGLISNGVSEYDWKQCRADYQLGVMATLFPAVNWALMFGPKRISNMKAAMQAFEDWDCGERIKR